MYEALHQRTIRIEIITGETNSLCGIKKTQIFPLSLHWTELCVFFFFTSAMITGV
jgi:hypothetical protein